MRTSPAPLSTLASSIYENLRRDILLANVPPGEKLRVERLCERYKTAGSPVREALNRLSAEGLVERREHRGFYVISIGQEDLLELVKTRCWLEEIALRQAMSRATSQWQESLVLCQHRLSRVSRSTSSEGYRENPEWERLHRDFHRTLISACGSSRLIRYCEEMTDHAYRYRQIALRKAFTERDAHAEHEAIVAAVLNDQADTAVKLLTDHYRRTASIVQADSLVPAAA